MDRNNAMRAMFCVAVGSAGVLLGAATGLDTGVDSKNATEFAAILSGAAANAGAGIVGATLHNGIKDGYSSVASRLREAAEKGKLPRNHDMLRALRRSHLNAVQFIVTTHADLARADRSEFDWPLVKRFTREIERWIADELKEVEKDNFLSGIESSGINDEFRLLIDNSSEDNAPELLAEVGRRGTLSALEEIRLALAVEVPGSFCDVFLGSSGASVGWMLATHAFFAEKLKTDPRLQAAVFGQRLSSIQTGIFDLGQRLASVQASIADIDQRLASRLAAIEKAIASQPRQAEAADGEALLSAVSAIVARIPGEEDFAKIIAAVLAATRPTDAWAAFRAARDAGTRFDELRATFFGREAELDVLDAWVNDADSSLGLVTAEAGTGKSALLAAWGARRRAIGDTVVQHFISRNLPATTSAIDTLRHLAQQLRVLDRSNAPLPGNEGELLDLLAARLTIDHPSGRLIVIVDGLDELATLWSDRFVRQLGVGVHVVVSCRATPGTWPRPLAPWDVSFDTTAQHSIQPARLHLSPLAVADLLVWLEELIGYLGAAEVDALARAIHETTDGLPLFIKLVLDDLKARLPSLACREDRIAFVSGLPQPFADYAAAELRAVQAAVPEMSETIEALFALLAVARSPLGVADLNSLMAIGAFDVALGEDIPRLNLDRLGHGVIRWLDVRGEGRAASLAFAHPRLATVFAAALAELEDSAARALISWSGKALVPQAETTASLYGLLHLPGHLIKRSDYRAAANLLMEPSFIRRRLTIFGVGSAASHMIADWVTIRDDYSTKMAARHRRFWRNSATFGFTVLGNDRFNISAIACLMADLGLSSVAGALSIDRPDLIPQSEAAVLGHSEWVNDAFLLADGRVLSWGQGNALQIWEADCTLAADMQGHTAPVQGALQLSNGNILSWGQDHMLRLWSPDGIEGPVLVGHQDYIEGARELTAGHILSWSADRTLRTWSSDGEPKVVVYGHEFTVSHAFELKDRQIFSLDVMGRARLSQIDGSTGHFLEGHRKDVLGALALEDGGILSWSSDNSLRIWRFDRAECVSIEKPIHRQSWRSSDFIGALQMSNKRILSWGMGYLRKFVNARGKNELKSTYILQLWEVTGIAGPIIGVHHDRINGVIELCDGSVLCWDDGGDIRLWSTHDGPDLAFIGHEAAVNGVLVRTDGSILSWSDDGTIRLWTAEGVQVQVIRCPSGSVRRVLELGNDRILSWGGEKFLRLWAIENSYEDIDGARRRNLSSAIVLTDGRILSWGEDSDLVIWSVSGKLEQVLEGHRDEICGALELSDGRICSWSLDGTLRLWGGDGTIGPVLQGHGAWVGGALQLSAGYIISWSEDSVAGLPQEGHYEQNELDGIVFEVVSSSRTPASLGHGSTLRVWTSDGAHVATLEGHTAKINGALEMRNGEVVSWSDDRSLILWSTSGRIRFTLTGHNDSIKGAFELSDGRICSWSLDATLRIWATDGTPGPVLKGYQADLLGASRLTGNRILTWGSESLPYFQEDFRTATEDNDLEDSEFLTFDASYGDGPSILCIWTADGDHIKTLEGHRGRINGAMELSRGSILSWGSDKTLRIWGCDGSHGPILEGHISEVLGAIEVIDQRFLSWCQSGALRFWTVEGSLLGVWFSPAGAIDHVESAFNSNVSVVSGNTVFLVNIESIIQFT